MDSVSRWCEECFEDTLHTVVSIIGTRKKQKKIIEKKIFAGYKCEICGKTNLSGQERTKDY